MKKILLVCLGLVIAPVSAYIIYATLLTPKLTSNPNLEPTSTPILELIKMETNEDGSFTVYVRNNFPEPTDGYLPRSHSIDTVTLAIVVYDQNDKVIFTTNRHESMYPPHSSPQQTVAITFAVRKNIEGSRVIVPLEIGYSVMVTALTETKQELFSNKLTYNG